MTRVVLHVGMSKAGSSSLQTAFARRQGEGFAYPGDDVAARGLPSKGNAFGLFEVSCLPVGSGREERIAAWLDDALVGSETVVLSSEFFIRSTDDEAASIVGAIRERAELVTVAVVRNVYEHAISAWMHVARNLPDLTFAEYCERFYAEGDEGERSTVDSHVLRASQITPLLRWGDVTGDLRVVHLDSDPSTLVERVFAATGLQLGSEPTGPLVVNRGLTYAQFELVRAAARRDPRLADLLTGRLVAIAGRRGVPMFGPELDALERRFVHGVDLVNRRWFSGAPVVRIAPSIDRVVPVADLEPDESTLALVELLPRLLALAEQQVLERPDRWDDSPARAAGGHPDGFDPVAYLLANPDLLVDDVDPWSHWVESGHAEGRPLERGAEIPTVDR